ncbi:sugar kinase and transcription regulator [Agrilactobacillus composti DSM 18527 = JCM 14202]|uniref:Sugar kinase and transcription regulator n=2 Tax=Agrilactobacillus TaxID=2767875 RepID=A0A0R1YB49_9LACO|nr:ROK family protein [Agrilactobacillus composti]KRM36268.1 sugar kinase and transcription regulator [Agrilactobacillus composti DSM 18527 = JCM 14202]
MTIMTTAQYLVFDVGGTTIKYGLLDDTLQLQATGQCPTLPNEAGHILKELLRLSLAFQADYPLQGIGVSTAGIVGVDGAIQYAGPTIPGYQGTPIQAKLEAATGLPVFVVNDVAAALLGEQLAGGAKNASSVYCVALGTGIGGAYLDHGKLLSGANGTANSVGYLLYDPATQTNYEQRAATLALEALVTPLGVSVPDAFAQARLGKAPFADIISHWAVAVAQGLAQIILLFDPEILLIGGAVSQQGDYLLTLLQNALTDFVPQGLCQTRLKVAELADKAQLYGAFAGIQAKR